MAADAEGQTAAESDAAGDEPRRRRRRRGGRGRGRRGDRREDGGTVADSRDAESLPGYGRNLDEERHKRRTDRPSTGGLKADIRPHAPWEDEFGRGLDEEAEDLLDEASATDRSADRGSRTTAAEGDADGEERPRRRRRRRRGRRNRDETEPGDAGETTARPDDTDEGEAAEAVGEAGDASGEGEAATAESGDEPTRRRRRRRRRRSGESADEAGEAPAGRPRRSTDDSSGSRQRSARGGRRRETGRGADADVRRRRRETFSRVGEGRDEDDEGLEFLGMEESSAEAGDRRPAGDEELLAESGLDSVRDVPSWVEAIGIVIAGNMDSRKQPPKG